MKGKLKTSDSGTKNTGFNIPGTSNVIFIHMNLKPRNRWIPTLIFTYSEPDISKPGKEWSKIGPALNFYKSEPADLKKVKDWLKSNSLEAFFKELWAIYVNLKDGRI